MSRNKCAFCYVIMMKVPPTTFGIRHEGGASLDVITLELMTCRNCRSNILVKKEEAFPGYGTMNVVYVKHGSDEMVWTNSIAHPMYKTPIVCPKPSRRTILSILMK